MAVCASCGSDLPTDAKFCPSCGASIAPRTDERRIVSVLFADVVGFTPLSEDRDPEHVKNLLDRCFDRLAADVTAHGGRIDKIVGDEIMAIFGAPVAHEDDPERAVRAALQMQRTLGEHAQETAAEVRMRIGVNTGEVLVGALRAGGDVTALGDVVNTAKRLQTSSDPGDVVVAEATYAATRDVVRYEPIGSLQVKGREAPVEAWRAMEPFGPPGFRPRGTRRPLIGRKAELGVLWQALSTAVGHKRPHFVLLVGDAGVGKTLLVDEALEFARSEHNALILEGRCLPYGEANPWWPVAEALREACDIDPDDPAEEAETKCRQAVAAVIGTADEGAEASRVADGLLYLMGYGGTLQDVDPSRAQEEAVRAVQLALAANARRRPLVIVLSEIHWAGDEVLELIDTMFDRLRDLPVVLLGTARPELAERWSPKPGRHNLFVVNLDGLARDDARKLARTLLPDDASDDLVDLIVERSGGNPLFIDELAKLLCDNAPRTAGHLDVADLPATLRGLVAARLDSLDRGERSVLEDASVVGRSGPVDALEALAEARGETTGPMRLTTLANKDLLVVEDGEYEFKSELVRDVAYETLTKGDRARRHAAVGGWMAEYIQRTDRGEELLERIAHHFAQAAQLVSEVGVVDGVPTDVLDHALHWLDKAATRAESRETTASLVHLLDHALLLVSDDQPEYKARFLLGRAKGRATLREMEGAHADIDAAWQTAQDVDDDKLRAQALTVRGDVEQREGELAKSGASLEEAVTLWQKVGDRRGEAEALRNWGFTSIHRGEVDAAEKAIGDALSISRQLGDRRGEAWALQNLAWAAFTRGDNDLAEERLLAATNLFDEIGDFGGRTWAQGLLGYVWYFKGRLADAGIVAEGGVEITRETGDRWAHGMMLNLLSGVRLWQGRTKESLERAQRAKRLFEEIHDDIGLTFSIVGVAMGLLLTGRSEDALEMIPTDLLSTTNIFGGWGGILTAANICALVGDGDRALEIIDKHIGDIDEETVLTSRALALLVAGRAADAYDAGSRAWTHNPTDPGERANIASLLSIAAAAAGRGEDAVTFGDEVGRVGGSYMDQMRAHMGRAFGYARLGDDIRARSAIGSARRIIDTTEDDLDRALVRLAESVIALERKWDDAPSFDESNDRLVDLTRLGVAWEPWERLFRTAVGATD